MTDIQNPLLHVYEDDEISLLDILVTLAESWKLLVFVPLLVGMLAGALSFLWPNTYESIAIARLTEEEAALFHAAPVLDPLVDKFGYLDRAGGFREDARNAVKNDLKFTADKKTKLVTVLVKGSTPEVAQALGRAAFEALFVELMPKGKEKEAIEQEIAVNNQLISDGILYADRAANRQNNAKSQIANLKLINLELSFRLQAKGGEVFAQEPSLPQRKTSPNRRFVVSLAVFVSGVALLVFVFVRRAWQAAVRDAEVARKCALIRQALGLPSSRSVN
jgi:capsular polysaccharide biosynthesis protein